MFKLFIGVIIALLIGAACRYFKLPVPAPPTIYGVLLIMAITVGYIITDSFLPGDMETNTPQLEQTK
ncbi:MAG: DUF1427 family protein [Aridibacter sp.]|jgi:XapX domain-containing protein|nr:DUF1427 family protein [Acidobacteriota bacterium]